MRLFKPETKRDAKFAGSNLDKINGEKFELKLLILKSMSLLLQQLQPNEIDQNFT